MSKLCLMRVRYACMIGVMAGGSARSRIMR